MPTALIFTLRPTAAATVPANLSRAAHAWVLDLIQQADADLAEQMHADTQVRPFTVSNLWELPGKASSAEVSPERTYTLRVTLLTPTLEALAAAWTPDTLGTLTLGSSTWHMLHSTANPTLHPWAGHIAYEELAAGVLLTPGEPPTRWELEFASPVTFRQRGVNQPFPTPDLVFGSLLEKWNTAAALELPAEEVRLFASTGMAVSWFDLRSVVVPTKGKALQVGAVGRCTYTAVERGDRYWLACADILARFAFYSGVGAGTARGMGQTRLR